MTTLTLEHPRYLIHSPYGADSPTDLKTAWLAMRVIQRPGKAKPIGNSNHLQDHVKSIFEVATITPSVNQVEFHPCIRRENNYVYWLKEHGIQVKSYNGLTLPRKGLGGLLDAPLKTIAEKHGLTENAVLIQWQIQQEVVPITTSGKLERFWEYLKGVVLKLDPDQEGKIRGWG